MLQLIRDRATGWIAWFIIILICVPFALWGIQEYVSPQGSLTVAEVNDAEIGYYQFQNAYQVQRRQIERMLGQRISDPDVDRRLRRETLERLINDELLVQSVLDNGMRVGDGQLAEAIHSLPAFQGEAGFTQDAYDGFLRSRGMSTQGFELDLRRSLLGEQLLTAVQRSEVVTRAQIERVWKQRNRTRQYRRMLIAPEALEVDEPDEEAISKYFESHKEQFEKPERVKIGYIEIARADIAAEIPVEEEELKAQYENSKQNYRTHEQREARHILVQVPRDADEGAVQEAKQKIDAIRDRLQQGEDFGAVAKEVSDDPGSAASGGSLGYFGPDVMDPAFESAAFALEQGVLSEPVRSSFGWHLIEVTGIQAEKVRAFEDVRDELAAQYRDAEAEQLFAERVEELANLAFEHPESLEAAAQALDTQPSASEYFPLSGEGAAGIALNPRVRAAAFAPEVLEEGTNSELLELAPGRVAAIRVREREAARPLELDEARDRVREILRSDARAAKATEVGEAIVAAIKAGGDLDEAAAAHAQRFDDAAQASPAKPGALDGTAQSGLFSMQAPAAESQPGLLGLPTPNGGYQILALLSLEEAGAAPTDEESKQTRSQLEGALGSASFGAMMGSLRERAEVRVFEETLSSDSL